MREVTRTMPDEELGRIVRSSVDIATAGDGVDAESLIRSAMTGHSTGTRSRMPAAAAASAVAMAAIAGVMAFILRGEGNTDSIATPGTASSSTTQAETDTGMTGSSGLETADHLRTASWQNVTVEVPSSWLFRDVDGCETPQANTVLWPIENSAACLTPPILGLTVVEFGYISRESTVAMYGQLATETRSLTHVTARYVVLQPKEDPWPQRDDPRYVVVVALDAEDTAVVVRSPSLLDATSIANTIAVK